MENKRKGKTREYKGYLYLMLFPILSTGLEEKVSIEKGANF